MNTRKLGVLFILVLFTGVATQINAKVLDITTETTENNDPEPKICCFGSIALFNVKPGEVILDYFFVSNCGEKGSLLNWEVIDWPTWGSNWSFNSMNGINLPYNELKTITVSLVAPDVPRTDEFTGKIKVKNSDDPDDYCEVDVIISTSKIYNSPSYHFLGKLVENYPSTSV